MLVAYDVETTTPEGRKRLRQVSRTCVSHGVRVQNSVFECRVSPAEWAVLRSTLLKIMDPAHDSIRFYHLPDRRDRIEHHGVAQPLDLEGPLIL
jgi:CRISPR-associated protein Cas2